MLSFAMATYGTGNCQKVYNGFNGFNTNTPFLIGVAGGTASGKSTVCQKIMEKVGQHSVDHRQRKVVCISQDSFYRELTDEEKAKALKGKYNFDHPAAFDNELMLKILKDILSGKVVSVPVYDFKTNSRKKDEFVTVYPADVVLFEGILVFYFPEIRDLFHMKLFVDTDPDTRLSRRVLRDTRERGRDLDQILTQYTMYVKPAFEDFCLPTKKYADVIIPRGADNEVAIDLIVKHIQEFPRITSSKARDSSENLAGEGIQQFAIGLIVQTIQDRLTLVSPRNSLSTTDSEKSSFLAYSVSRPH